MPSTLPLILSREQITRGMRMKVSTPDIAVVYSDAYGRVASFEGRPLRWAQQVLATSAYRTRYEVDLSYHSRTAQLDSSPLPSRGDTYYFRSTVNVGFRVTDPAKVVKRNVTDGLTIVYSYLADAFRPVTRRHEIEDAEGAEDELNLLFPEPVVLEEGITIDRCRTQLLPDAAAEHYLRSVRMAGRNLHIGEAEHKVAAAAVRNKSELSEIEQTARLAAERRELEATSDLPMDLKGLIRAHLARHPSETAYAAELLQRHEEAQLAHRDINDQRTMDLARYMMEQGLIQAVDIEICASSLLPGSSSSPRRPLPSNSRPGRGMTPCLIAGTRGRASRRSRPLLPPARCRRRRLAPSPYTSWLMSLLPTMATSKP